MAEIAALILFVFSFIIISFEQRLRTNRAAMALTLGGLLWVFVIFAGKSRSIISQAAAGAGNEIFGIIMLLLTSMVLVVIMSEQHFFDFIREKLLALRLNTRKQFILRAMLGFLCSVTIDNMSIGLVMVQVGRQFFNGKN